MAPHRILFLLLGLVLTGVGIAGYILPGLPGTVFIIIALWCFKRSSSRMESWLLNHKWFGSILRDWDENHWISARVKWISVGSIWLFGIGSIVRIHNPWIIGSVLLLAIAGTVYILMQKTKPNQAAAEVAKPIPSTLSR